MNLSEKGYIKVNNDLLNEHEKEEIFDLNKEVIIESQYVYFNSTNKSELLIYNRLSNTLLRISEERITEYVLPDLYKQEFSSRPVHMILYTGGNEELHSPSLCVKSSESLSGCFSYILEDYDKNQKTLVYRKISVTKDAPLSDNKHTYKWEEVEYMECKVMLNGEELRGIMWWSFHLNFIYENPNENGYNEENNDPSILLITCQSMTLYTLKDRNMSSSWRINERNVGIWYNMEFQCILFQISPNKLLPYVNIGMNENQRPVKLQALELSISEDLKYKDIILVKIYNSLYCMHMDGANKRISLRDMLNHENCDLVLDVNDSFGEFSVVLIDNLVVVLNLYNEKVFSIYDIKLLLLNKKKQEFGNVTSNRYGYRDLNQDSHLEYNNDKDRGESLDSFGSYYRDDVVYDPENEETICKEIPNNGSDEKKIPDLKKCSDSAENYYIVPSLFTDKFTENTVICLYGSDETECYKKLVGKDDGAEIDTILLINSCMNVVIRLHLNKIQYSKLLLSERELIGNIVNIGGNRERRSGILPFILHRDVSNSWRKRWDIEFVNRIKEIYAAEKKNNQNKSKITLLVTYVLEIIKLKLDAKQDIADETYLLLLELVFYLKNESLLHYLLQYHIINDSNKILKELFNLYLYNINHREQEETKTVRFELDKGYDSYYKRNRIRLYENYFVLENKLWLEQVCLDVAYRLRNLNILIRILIIRKEYRRIIRLLRQHSQQKIIFDLKDDVSKLENAILSISTNSKASKFPIYYLLYKVGTDIHELESNPNILIDLIKQVKNWISDYNSQIDVIKDKIKLLTDNSQNLKYDKVNVYVVGKPNIHKCSVWLPELTHLDSNPCSKNIADTHNTNGEYYASPETSECSEGDLEHAHKSTVPTDRENELGGNQFEEDNTQRTNTNTCSHSTNESIYISAVESNETFASSFTREECVSTSHPNNVLSLKSNAGKSPILHFQSRLLIQDAYDKFLDSDPPFSSEASYTSSSESSKSSFDSRE